jgi:hypothetical protein
MGRGRNGGGRRHKGILVLYTNTKPASGPHVATDVENGKLVKVEELQWQISNKPNSNGVSPTLKNSNGVEPNNPCQNGPLASCEYSILPAGRVLRLFRSDG